MRGKTVLKRLACFCLAAVMVLGIQPPARASAKNEYPEVDAFQNSLTSALESYKGIQGARSRQQFYDDPISHSVWNCFLDNCVGSGESYEYKGETYHFKFPMDVNTLYRLNKENVTVSIVFLLRWNDSNTYLIADEARTKVTTPYYAPAYDPDTKGGKTMEAFWHFVMETCAKNGVHIDNFILGNEVNMPDHWHYSGTLDVSSAARMYASAFSAMRDAVEEYSSTTRCSISLDHSWQHNDQGRGIAAKTYLDTFASYIGKDSNWCISYHMYPSVLTYPQIWQPYQDMDLNPVDDSARFVDGRNLSIMTNYVKNTYGEKHRIMMTEEGFSSYYGDNIQAASLAYSYLAAKYDPMVDCFVLHIVNEGGMQNYSLSDTAQKVWKALDGPEKDQAVVDQCLSTIGVSSWSDIIPNYGIEQEREYPSGLILDEDGIYRVYKKDGSLDSDYTGWYITTEGTKDPVKKMYLLKNGVQVDQEIPYTNTKQPGWYRDGNSFHWMDADGSQAKDKAVYDSLSDAWYVINKNGDISFDSYDIDGKFYSCDSKSGVWNQKTEDITGKDLEWCTASGKSYWYENGVRQGTYDDKAGVMGDGTIRGREIHDPESNAWYWLDACYEGAKACNKEVWIPYIFQDEDEFSSDEALLGEKTGMSNEMSGQVKNAIIHKTGKWVRYDAEGRMCKGWYTVEGDQAEIYPEQAGNTYYYDPITGLMAKGTVTINGEVHTFDGTTGVLQK